MLKIVIAFAVLAVFVHAQNGIMGIRPPVGKPYIDKGPGHSASQESGDGRRPPDHGKNPGHGSHESREDGPGHGRPNVGPRPPPHFPLFPPWMCYPPSSTGAPPVSGAPSSPAPIDVAASSAAPPAAASTMAAPVEGATDAPAASVSTEAAPAPSP